MRKYDTNQISFLGIVFIILILVETFFFKSSNLIYIILGPILLYYGVHQRSKWTFYLGIFFILIAVLNLWSLRLVILGLLLYLLIKLWHGIPSTEILKPIRSIRKEPSQGIWKNKLFSIQSTPFSSYEWEDMHIQGLFGEIKIDVTETVLPKGTSFISIRQGIGKIKIELPYEIPVRVYYTTLLGDATLFNSTKKRLINEVVHVKDGYHENSTSSPELIVTISTWAGDVEVVRK